jgi:hypothetical protein
VAGIQLSTYFFSMILTDQLRAAAVAKAASESPDLHLAAPVQPPVKPADEGRPPVLASLVILPADYGVLCLCFVLLGFHDAFVWVYSAITLAGVALLVAALGKWFRDLSRLA